MKRIIDIITKKCSTEIYQPIQKEYDNVYISIDIHHTYTAESLLQLVETCKPTKLLFLSVEGVVPLALLKSRKHQQMKEINYNDFIKQFHELYPSYTISIST